VTLGSTKPQLALKHAQVALQIHTLLQVNSVSAMLVLQALLMVHVQHVTLGSTKRQLALTHAQVVLKIHTLLQARLNVCAMLGLQALLMVHVHFHHAQ